jgi:BirA family biotin operon repressor/biotin-[acetyl-CoA-carboxylase] ligase
LFDRIGSTLDAAHTLGAEGAAAGTVILADTQTAGRGRMGRAWRSESGTGIWLTVLERPSTGGALGVLALRVGLALAPAIEPFADAARIPIRLKWPNDLYAGTGKVGGILVEARWRDQLPEWVAIGVGINLRAPAEEPNASGLRAGVSRVDVLTVAVRAIRAAAARTEGTLDHTELAAFARRDLAAGLRCVEPAVGRVLGIDASGALLVDVASRGTVEVRTGSLVLQD